MSLIKVRRIATVDSEAKDIQLPFIITFNNGKKEFREGYSAEEVRRRFDKGVAALYGGIKSVKLESEDKRDGKDSSAADSKFKKGDKIRRGVQTGIVRDIEKEPYIEVKFTDQPVTVFVHESEIVAADSRAAGDAAEFHVGQRVRAKDPRWAGYQGHALGNGMYTVKKVDRDGTVKLDGFLNVWISPSALVEANDACGNRSK